MELGYPPNLKPKPGDPDYWERSRLEMFAIGIGWFVREYHQPPRLAWTSTNGLTRAHHFGLKLVPALSISIACTMIERLAE